MNKSWQKKEHRGASTSYCLMLCSMANANSLPLYEKTWPNPKFRRVMDSFILLLLLLLLTHRIFSFFFFNNYTFPLFLAFLCESSFTITWAVILSTKWSPTEVKTFPERLLHRVSEDELPPVDLFVTTADAVLEPPILTVNTVLSLLALDYPTHRLACYVSDDGCSSLTFYALVEATKFAKRWVPFCKKYNVQVRAPFRYFSDEAIPSNGCPDLLEFKQEWLEMKNEYEHLSYKIQDAKSSLLCHLDKELTDFSHIDRRNHPTIIKVLWNNKECLSNGLPHLVYISREKRPQHPHHYKAGAMNVLVRVSSLMTNAPFMLNVDCDMFVNNPKIVLHAMCIFLDSKINDEVAFVQCPQRFYNGIKDDPFGNQFVTMFKYIVAGIAGLQGPFYFGTNCFHRRKVIYGLSAPEVENQKKDRSLSAGKLLDKDLVEIFGSSEQLVKSAADALVGKTKTSNGIIPSEVIEKASKVAGCGYESGTAWGKQVGWLYGSVAEDNLTGLEIHRKGWRSELCLPNPIAFTGCAPRGLPLAMTQQKRWASGLLEIFFSKHCPILCVLFGKLQLRQCLAYLWLICWGLRSVPELCYAVLSAYCIITNSQFLPQEFGLWILIALLVIYNINSLTEYMAIGLSIREWWNNHRMARIGINAWFCGLLSAIFKLLGMSETVFEVTQKEPPTSNHDESITDVGSFIFTRSPVFVPGTTILLLQLTALAIYLLGLQPSAPPASAGGGGCGLGEVFCSTYLVVCYWPFLKGLFGKGKYGIPLSTVCKSALLAFGFVYLSRSAITA